MATPTLTRHTVPGALGEILVDVRAGSRSVAQPAVLLVHGFKGFKDYAFLPVFAERLARAGFTAVTATVSGAGVDAAGEFSRLDRFARNTYSRELDDLHGVATAIATGTLAFAAPTALGVVGHSRGGGMAILLAAERPEVGALVTWNAIGKARRHSDAELAAWREAGTIQIPHKRLRIRMPLDYEVVEDCLRHEHGRLDIAAAAGRLTCPWLQLHGTDDETVAFAEGEALAAAGGAQHAFVPVAGGTHTWGTQHPWEGSTSVADEVFDRTVRFLSSTLP
jgi:dienelactone hydrolase